MSRRKAAALIAFLTAVTLAGCGGGGVSSNRTAAQGNGVKDILNSEIEADEGQEGTGTGQGADSEAENAPVPSFLETESPDDSQGMENNGSNGSDVDLTALSSTMVYTEVYSMLLMPDEYVGRKVRMQGAFSVYHDKDLDKDYFFCIVKDATACCSQGIEFCLLGDHRYPEDYPGDGEEITVSGTFGTYQENGATYCRLEDAKLE
jgi:hypothetical protein